MARPLELASISVLCRLRVSCTYAVSSHTPPLNVQLLVLPEPHPQTQPGPLTLELQIAKGKTLLARASGPRSESCHSSGHEDPVLAARHLLEELMGVMVCLKQPRVS